MRCTGRAWRHLRRQWQRSAYPSGKGTADETTTAQAGPSSAPTAMPVCGPLRRLPQCSETVAIGARAEVVGACPQTVDDPSTTSAAIRQLFFVPQCSHSIRGAGPFPMKKGHLSGQKGPLAYCAHCHRYSLAEAGGRREPCRIAIPDNLPSGIVGVRRTQLTIAVQSLNCRV